MAYDYLYKREVKPGKEFFMKQWNLIFADARNYFSINLNLVGSSKRNLILTELDNNHDPIGKYDFDYQIVISKINNEEKFKTPKSIKDYFFNQFRNRFSVWKVENSTTAITIRNGNKDYFFDVVVCLKLKNKPFKVIKRADSSQGQDKYICEEVPEYKNHKENLRLIKGTEKWTKVREVYKDKKVEYKNKQDKKSYLIFIEAVKETVDFFNQKN